MIPPTIAEKLKKSLVKHEGRKTELYRDSLGLISGGIGYNFTDRGIPNWFIDRQYDEDVQYLWKKWSQFPWWSYLNDDRKIVLVDFSFMGWQHVLEFKHMFDALAYADYETAGEQMLLSLWAKQVGHRAIDLSNAMISGVYNL